MIYLYLFWEFFQTGLFAFGGGLATLPFLSNMAARYGWFTQAELTNMLAVSEATPGPIGVNMATYCGMKTAGVPGACIATFGLVLPSVLCMLLLASLLVIIGRTTAFIIDLRDASLATELWLAFAALAICLGQFKVGRMLGRRYGDAPAGGQSLGQKNTVLAVWMAQSFLDPISSIAPTAYIVWQNFVNSYQIWRKDRGK